METPPPSNTVRLSFTRVLMLAILLVGITNVPCQAYDLKFTSDDGTEWEFTGTHSSLTHYEDVNFSEAKSIEKGTYYELNGKFHIRDASFSRKWRARGREDYRDLQAQLLSRYPDCEATMWETDNNGWVYAFPYWVDIEFKGNRIKKIKR